MRSCDALCEHMNQKITMITADEQPHIELFHDTVDVILVAAKRMDSNYVARNDSG